MKLALALVLMSSTAYADGPSAGGFSAGGGLGGVDQGEGGGGPSPEHTQDRTFGATRFWKLDEGAMQGEVWWRFRDPRGADNHYNILQLEYEVGLTDRVQLDLYGNFTDERGSWGYEGSQVETRIAFDPVYGRTPLNPVLYLEAHSLHLGPVRGEVKLLLGDDVIGEKLFGAVNLVYEQNLTDSVGAAGAPEYVPNPEAAIVAAASYAIVGQTLRVGAEAKLALEKEEFEDAEWEKQLLAGPNVSTRIAGPRLKLLATCLFGITDDAKAIDAYLILGSAF